MQNALFDPTTYSPAQAAVLNNIPGQSLADTNSAATISGAQAITPQSLTRSQEFPLYSPTGTQPYPVANLLTPTAPLTPTPQETKITGLNDSLKGLYNSLIGKSSFQTEQNTKFGVDAAQSSITDLTAHLTQLKNEAAAIPLQMDKRISEQGTILTGGYTSEMNTRLRDNAIAALGVSTLLAASQGQLSNAQALADKAVGQKYDPILEQIAATTHNLEIIKSDPETSIEDKNRAQAQIDIQNKKAADTKAAADNATQIWSIATDAAQNLNTFKPTTDYKTSTVALQAISQAPTKEKALEIAVKTGLVKTTPGKQQIIGSATTGYFTVDENGKVTPLRTGPTPTNPVNPVVNSNTLIKNLQAQRIPAGSANKDGSLNTKYAKRLYDAGLSPEKVTWMWNAVKTGSSFDEIRAGIRNGGGDPKILDTFVQTLQS